MSARAAAALVVLAAAPLAAQGPRSAADWQNVRPASCPAADSLAGRPLNKPKEAASGWRREGQHFVVSSDPWAVTGRHPVEAIMLNAIYQGETPLPEAWFTMQLRLKDSVLRSGTGTILTLLLDSVETEIGAMEVAEGPMSYGHTVDQMLTRGIPVATARRLALARDVHGRIGATEFVVPPKTLETFHSVFLAATCGAHLR